MGENDNREEIRGREKRKKLFSKTERHRKVYRVYVKRKKERLVLVFLKTPHQCYLVASRFLF